MDRRTHQLCLVPVHDWYVWLDEQLMRQCQVYIAW